MEDRAGRPVSAPRLVVPLDARTLGPAVAGFVPGFGSLGLVTLYSGGLGLLNPPGWLHRAYEVDPFLRTGAYSPYGYTYNDPYWVGGPPFTGSVTELLAALQAYLDTQTAYRTQAQVSVGASFSYSNVWLTPAGLTATTELPGVPLFTTQDPDDNDLSTDFGWDVQGWQPVKPPPLQGGEGLAS